jgi:hypothetical protein
MLLAKAAQVLDIFAADYMPFLEGASLEFTFNDLGYIMRQDHAHCHIHRNTLFHLSDCSKFC